VAVLLDGAPARLKKFLDTMQRQSFSNYEVLVCGTPTEAEEQLLRQSASKDLRIHFIPTDPDDCLRAALLQASGDYLLFPTVESIEDLARLQFLHEEAQNANALLLADTGTTGRHAVRCDSGSVLYHGGWLPNFFLTQPAKASMAGILAAREVYKPAIDWIEFFECVDPFEGCALAIFVTAAFSLFATKVSAFDIDTVRLRNHALEEALAICGTNRCALKQGELGLPDKIISVASRIFTMTVVHNQRLGKNSRLRLVSDWNKALRDTLGAHFKSPHA
jgi:hypothetical protein